MPLAPRLRLHDFFPVGPTVRPPSTMSRILIIDDDDILREILALTLQRVGHDVLQAGDGSLAADIIEASPVDVVITDIIMPGQEGIETIQQLKRLHPALPVIAMSGTSTHSKIYLDIAGRLGACRMLGKPFTIEELLGAIAEALAGTAAPPPVPHSV